MIVAGKVRAKIISQQVEICATGNVRGDVAASTIVIHAGGQLEGVVRMRNGVGRSTYGQIPDAAIVVARSGRGRFWPDKLRYLGTDGFVFTNIIHAQGDVGIP